jgi:tetratricopeptide (TPR) repeat protein
VAQLTKALGEPTVAIEERAVVLASRFVERKPIVTSLLKRALSREGGVIVLQGPAGLGLSRLLQELRGDFVVRGGRPALVKGGPDVLLDVLDSLVGPLVAAETRDALLGDDKALLLDSFPELRRKGERGAEARPYQRVRLATARVVRRATEDGRPLLLAVDDAERAHPADLRCLVGPGLLVLATHLPERLEIVGEAMEIPPLSPGAMAEMARSIIGDSGATLAWEESELLAGNPKELVRRAQQWALAARPVRTAVEPASEVLDWDRAIEGFERALVHQHPSQIIARLEEEPAEPPSASVRWRMAALASWAHSLAGQDKESLVHATRAAELAPTDGTRLSARLLGARCALRRGHYGACLEEAAFSWHQAEALRDADLALQWSAHEVETLLDIGRIYEAQLVLERASAKLPQGRVEGRLALEWAGARVATVLCEWNEALMRIAEVRGLVQSPPRPRVEAGMYIEEGRVELRRGQVARARALLVHAMGMLEPLGDAECELRGSFALAQCHLMEGNRDASRQAYEQCLALAERTASRAGLGKALVVGLRLARVSADSDLAIELIDRVAQLPPNWSDEASAAVVHSERALALVLLGDTDGAKAALQKAEGIGVEDPHDDLLVRLHALQLKDALGDALTPDAALEIAVEARTLGLGHIERMAKGLALRRGASIDVHGMVAEAKRAGDLLAALWSGATILPEVRADADERGFQSLVKQ